MCVTIRRSFDSRFFYGPALASLLELAATFGIDAPHMPHPRRFPEHHRPVRRGGCHRNILSPVHADPAARVLGIGNVHRHRETGIPDALFGTYQHQASGLGPTLPQCRERIPMGSRMDLQRDALFDATQQPETETECGAGAMQAPVLVIGFQRKAQEPLHMGAGIGIADGLIDPRRADFHAGKGLGGQCSAMVFGQGEDGVGHFGVQPFQTRKHLRLCLIQAEKRKFERFGECCHIISLINLAQWSKMRLISPYMKVGALRRVPLTGWRGVAKFGACVGRGTARRCCLWACDRFRFWSTRCRMRGLNLGIR